VIAEWEDASAPAGGGGTYEWWYFDAVLDDGSTLVINFMAKDFRDSKGVNQPATRLSPSTDRPDAPTSNGPSMRTATSISRPIAAMCGSERTRSPGPSDLSHPRGQRRRAADVTLIGHVPSWRRRPAHPVRRRAAEDLRVAGAVPQGRVEAILTSTGRHGR